MSTRRHDREFVRTFFTSPTAVEGEEDSAKMLRGAIGLRGMRAPDVWVPDNEDATAPSMREEGAENIAEVVAESGAEFPGEIHPRVVWHREDPATRYRGFEHMLQIADPERGAVEHIDGFVIPEVGGVDDWKKADECLTVVETEHGLGEGSLAMSVIVESATAELAMGKLREEIGKPSNNLERLFMLVDGEVDYTKDMRAMTPTGGLPAWPELRHNTSRGASAAGLIAVDGREVELRAEEVRQVYDGDDLELDEVGDGRYRLRAGGDERELDGEELREELLDMAEYVPGMGDIVDSMEEFEAAKEAGRGAVSMSRSATLVVDGIEVEISTDRMWDEATYQAAMTPIDLFQDVYEYRPDQHEELAEMYGESVVERATDVG